MVAEGQECHLPAVGLRGPRQVQRGPAVWLGGDLPGGAGGLQLGWIFGKFASWCRVRRAILERRAKPELATRNAHDAALPPPLVPLLVPELRSG